MLYAMVIKVRLCCKGVVFAGVIALVCAAGAASAQDNKPDNDPEFLSLAVGAFDFNRQKDEGVEGRIEYRSDNKLLFFKPFGAIGYATSGHGFVGAGVLLDLYFGRRIVVTPSFAPHFYVGGDDDLDLDYPLEFRSQLEMSYRFNDRSRMGLAVSHYSNASLGDTNPGTESAMIYYSLPLNNILGR